jgi:cell division septum initiation protein DivIVA
MRDLFKRVVEMDEQARQIVESAETKGEASIQVAKKAADARIASVRENTMQQEQALLADFNKTEEKMHEENARLVEDMLVTIKAIVEKNWDKTIEAGLAIFEKLK